MHDPPVYLLDFLPPDLRLVVEPQVAAGWAAMFGVLAYLLGQRQLPKARLVPMCAGAAPGVDGIAAKRLLAVGGLPEFSLDALLAAAEEEAAGASALGGSGGGQPPAACANDDAFDLLRQHLFCDSNVWPCGPYVMDGGEGGEYGEADDGWVSAARRVQLPRPPPLGCAPLPALLRRTATDNCQLLHPLGADLL